MEGDLDGEPGTEPEVPLSEAEDLSGQAGSVVQMFFLRLEADWWAGS